MKLAATIALVLLGSLIAAMVLFLIARRALQARSDRADHARADELRPLVVAWLTDDADTPPTSLTDIRDARGRDMLARLFSRYGTVVSGDARARIATFVDAHGYVDAAIRDLRSRRAWRRGRTARMLGDFGSARAVRHLARLVTADPDLSVRLAATRALGRIDDYKSAAALLIALPEHAVPSGVVAQSLLDLDAHAFRALLSACDDEDVAARRIACRLVGLVGAGTGPDGMRRAQEVLLRRAVHDGDSAVRAAAVGSIGVLGSTQAIPAIDAALVDPDRDVRRAGIDAARQLYARDLAPRLLDLVTIEMEQERPVWMLVREALHAWAVLAESVDDASIDPALRERIAPFIAEALEAAQRTPGTLR